MSACIFYHPDAFSTKDRQIMGRRVAGESFLNAFVKYRSSKDLWIQVDKLSHAKQFAEFARELGERKEIKVILRQKLSSLKQPGCVYLPGPGLGEWARHRSMYGDNKWSICGITHTTASKAAMEAISELLMAPVQPWDALICTSRAVHSNVSRVLESQEDYLRFRFHSRRILKPQLPIIPLGVDSAAFVSSSLEKKQARINLNIPVDALVVLFVGRLSFHSKAHPFAMYRAIEEAVNQTGKSVILLQCGCYPNEKMKESFSQASRLACPSIETRSIDGSDSMQFRYAWMSADIFCSLADNIQEAFGITPLEAMAAGLPVVVSDWDGYRDTVRNEIDGFRIPTISMPSGYAKDIAERYALGLESYDMYIGYVAAMVSVDIDAAVEAFKKLFSSSELRTKMGESGRCRARDIYDWKVIIPRYEELWFELNERRKAFSQELSRPIFPFASGLDPFYAFESYSTTHLLPTTTLKLFDTSLEESLKRFREVRKLTMFEYVEKIMAPDDKLLRVVEVLALGPSKVEDLICELTETTAQQIKLSRSLVWMIKMGVIKEANQSRLI